MQSLNCTVSGGVDGGRRRGDGEDEVILIKEHPLNVRGVEESEFS